MSAGCAMRTMNQQLATSFRCARRTLHWFIELIRASLAYFRLPSVRRGATVVYLIGLTTRIIVGVRYGTPGFHRFTVRDFYEQLDDELFKMMAPLPFFSFAALDMEVKLRTKLQIIPENHHN